MIGSSSSSIFTGKSICVFSITIIRLNNRSVCTYKHRSNVQHMLISKIRVFLSKVNVYSYGFKQFLKSLTLLRTFTSEQMLIFLLIRPNTYYEARPLWIHLTYYGYALCYINQISTTKAAAFRVTKIVVFSGRKMQSLFWCTDSYSWLHSRSLYPHYVCEYELVNRWRTHVALRVV